MSANTAGANDHGACRVADIGWFLFEMGIEYDYIYYDEEFDEIHVAHPGGLVLLGADDDVSGLSILLD